MRDVDVSCKSNSVVLTCVGTDGVAVAAAGGGKADEAAASGRRALAPTPKIGKGQIACLAAVILIFIFSIAGTIILWNTDMWQNYIDQQLMIRNNTATYDRWVKSPVTSTIYYRVFNYTNVKEFLSGKDRKLRVEEVGPFAFRETIHRQDIKFHDNGTVSYKEVGYYDYLPEKSNGSINDNITSIHIVFMSMNFLAQRMSSFESFPLWTAMKLLNPQPLVSRSIREWFWGYHDAIKAIAELKETNLKVGIIETANGTATPLVTIYSGETDINKIGMITNYDGLEQMPYYKGWECNRVDGSDSNRFPPKMLAEKREIQIYHREACRRLPLVYEREVTVWDDIPAMRYQPPIDLFDNGEKVPENKCYCTKTFDDPCYPSGVVNTKHCRKGSPLLISFPHFMHADKVLQQQVDGLNPDPERHTTAIDIHQRIGAAVAVKSRFQVSMFMKNTFGGPLLQKLDEMILPFLWTEKELDEFPEDLRAVFRLLSFTEPVAHTTLRWLCPLLATVTGLLLLACLYIEAAALLRTEAPPPPSPTLSQHTRL